MKTVLLVSELGGGFGHVRRLLPLAREAAAQGFTPVFLVRNPREVQAVIGGEPFEVRTAPSIQGWVPALASRTAIAHSFADVLGNAGLSDAAMLRAALQAWDRTLADIRPKAIICEHSPLLCLAVWRRDVPTLVVGYGFVLPPPHLMRFPPLSDALPTHDERLLLDNVRVVLAERGSVAPQALPALFAGHAHFVTGLDELDPYRSLRLQPAVGLPGAPPQLTALDGDEVFAYLLGDAPATHTLLAGLNRSGARGRVYVRRGTAEQRHALAGGGMIWLEDPTDTRLALDRARLVVHHGSMLMSEEALLAGRPQLVVPLYLEHLVTAHALEALGVGKPLVASARPEMVDAAIAQVQSDAGLGRAAQAFARAAQPAPDPARLLDAVLADA